MSRGFLATPDDRMNAIPPLGTVLSLQGRGYGTGYALDSSPYGNHGTITGATWERLSGGVWVNSFDGSDDLITIGQAGSLANIQPPVTFMTWIYSTAYESSYRMVMTKSSKCELRLNDTSKTIQWWFTDVDVAATTTVMVNGTSYFVAGTYDGSIMRVFLNGVVEGTHSTTNAIPDNTGIDLVIGARSGGGFPWPGRLALGRIVMRALSPAEVGGIFQSERRLFGV